MKPTEVRIGNLVEYDNNVFPIHSIGDVFPTLDTIEFGIGVVDWNNIKPISLTEEWLLRFGSYTWNGFLCLDAFSPGHPSQRFNLYWSEKDGFNCKSRYQGEAELGYKMRQIKHVHQLQNLYFALTGEELKLNETNIEK
ncbi:hypothetical protein [Spongiimicrobium salis]|uniref:hypothetical protein n=1 Tax=Spongiimicrobium salis TaxID=1667022 RepID=UPI00374C9D02